MRARSIYRILALRCRAAAAVKGGKQRLLTYGAAPRRNDRAERRCRISFNNRLGWIFIHHRGKLRVDAHVVYTLFK